MTLEQDVGGEIYVEAEVLDDEENEIG